MSTNAGRLAGDVDLMAVAAASPVCPPVLAAALLAGPHPGERVLDALAANPVVPLDLLATSRHLSAGTRALLWGRSGMGADTALGLLPVNASVSTVATMASSLRDPRVVAELAEQVVLRAPGSVRAATALLARCLVPTPALRQAAVTVAGSNVLGPATVSRIGHLVRRAALVDLADATQFAEQLRAVALTPDGRVRADLDRELTRVLALSVTPARVGTYSWITDPGTDVADIIAWAGTGRRWATVLRDHPDPDLVLTHAALRLGAGLDRWALNRIVQTGTLPADVRTEAAGLLLQRGLHATDKVSSVFACATAPMLERWVCDPASARLLSWLSHLRGGDRHGLEWRTLCHRSDLTGPTVQAIADADVSRGSWRSQVWTCLHPGTPPDLRAEAVNGLTDAHRYGFVRVRSLIGCVLTAVQHADGGLAVAHLPLQRDRTQADAVAVDQVSWSRLYGLALGDLLPQIRTPMQAHVLVDLAEHFTGSLSELFTVVAAAAA